MTIEQVELRLFLECMRLVCLDCKNANHSVKALHILANTDEDPSFYGH